MEKLSASQFARKLKDLICNDTDRKMVFFLGSGCSVSSGIGDAATLVKRWLPRYKKIITGDEKNYIEWAKEKFPGFNGENLSFIYKDVMEKLFHSLEERQAETEDICRNKAPGFGYAVLAQLLSHSKYGKHCNIILTTNFDDIMADALYLFTNDKPLVIVHESLISYVKINYTRPLIVKLHGDARIYPKHTEGETTDFEKNVKESVKKLLVESGLIFIGYGGNDSSVYNIINSLPPGAPPTGIYWVGNSIPDTDLGRELVKRNVVHVDHFDFDELMLFIKNEFELEKPNKKRIENIFDNYNEKFKNLNKKIFSRPETPENDELEKAADKAAKEFKDWYSVLLEASKFEKSEPDKADNIFKNGFKKFPGSVELNGAYAIFLKDIRKDYDRAEEYYKKALELDPDNAIVLVNYANFFQNIRKAYDRAEDYYKKALELAPDSANVLGNYALFLHTIRKAYDRAEDYYKKALELDPDNTIVLVNYAIFLKDIRKDYDRAEDYYKKAIELAPDNASVLGNYGNFLQTIRKDYDRTEDYYKKALELDSDNASILGNYALFLHEIRGDFNRAEDYYKKALELDSDNASILGNYALFLHEIRGDFNLAEEYYRKSIELAPDNAIVLGNYAIFLKDIRKGFEQAEDYYMKALELAPDNASVLGNYANFLQTIRKAYDRAEDYYKKALELAPDNANVLGNYASFLDDIRKDYDRAEDYYKKALELAPDNDNVLVNYAIFLDDIRKDYDRAEDYYKKALELDPNNASVLGNYAIFLKDIRKAYDRAEDYYKKTIELDPDNANNLGNYAGFLLAQGRRDEGKEYLFRAMNDAAIRDLILECKFYYYVHIDFGSEQNIYLKEIKKLILDNIRSPNFNLTDNVNRAIKDGHPEPEFLKLLAKVIADEVDAKELDKFEVWRNTTIDGEDESKQ